MDLENASVYILIALIIVLVYLILIKIGKSMSYSNRKQASCHARAVPYGSADRWSRTYDTPQHYDYEKNRYESLDTQPRDEDTDENPMISQIARGIKNPFHGHKKPKTLGDMVNSQWQVEISQPELLTGGLGVGHENTIGPESLSQHKALGAFTDANKNDPASAFFQSQHDQMHFA